MRIGDENLADGGAVHFVESSSAFLPPMCGVASFAGISALQRPLKEERANVKTQKERDDQRRKEKLAAIDEQVEQGTLKIRKMTAKERKANPPKPRPERGRRRR
jgi:hypothetical protein